MLYLGLFELRQPALKKKKKKRCEIYYGLLMFPEVTKQNVAQKPHPYTVYMQVSGNFLWFYVIKLPNLVITDRVIERV